MCALYAYDGFDHYGANADVNARQGTLEWTLDNTGSLRTPGRLGYGKALNVGTGGVIGSFNADKQEWFFGFAIFINDAFNVWAYDSIADDEQARVFFDYTGARFKAYNGTTLLGLSPPNVIAVQTWHFLEYRFKIDNAAGEIHVRADGIPVLDLTAVDTQRTVNALFAGVEMQPVDQAGHNLFWIDDFYYSDTAAGTNPTYPFTSFAGDMRVQTLFAIGNNGSPQWTPSPAVPNWQNIDETAMDGDTTYNFTAVANNVDLFNYQPLIGDFPEVVAVQVTGAFRKDAAGTRITHNLLETGGTTVEGADFSLPTTYAYWTDLFMTNPHTGLPWDASEVNALSAGYKLIS